MSPRLTKRWSVTMDVVAPANLDEAQVYDLVVGRIDMDGRGFRTNEDGLDITNIQVQA